MSEQTPLGWSDGPVNFEYDGHHGSGRGLELKLIPKRGEVSRDKPAVDGIHTVRLLQNVEMHLRPQSEKPGRPPERVQINSDGAFEFDLESNIVTFKDQVRVVRRSPEGNDNLDADVLKIVFTSAKSAKESDTAESEQKQKIAGNLEFSRLLAQGQRVKLVSHRSGVVALMQELTYDAEEKQIVMKDGEKVRVLQENIEFQCPELTLNHDENNQIISVLGRGAGKMFSINPETRRKQYEASWQKQIWKHPDPKSDQEVVEFHEKAILTEAFKMVLEAEIIKVWLKSDTDTKQTQVPQQPNDISASARNMKIQRLLAVNDVAFASVKTGARTAAKPVAELLGGVQLLEVWFEEGIIPKTNTAMFGPTNMRQHLRPANSLVHAPARRSSPAPVVVQQARPVRVTQQKPHKRLKRTALQGRGQVFASTPDQFPTAKSQQGIINVGNENPPQQIAPPEKPTEPIDIVADHIQVYIIREGEENHVSKVSAFRKVDVLQEHQDGEDPLRIQCDQLHMLNPDQTNKHQQIFIQGKKANQQAPEIRAHVRDRGMHIEGVSIETDRKRNIVFVKTAGLMQLPVKNSLDGQILAQPALLSVWWQEKMHFDGLVAKFYDKVRIVHEGSTVSCGQMNVTLTEQISLSETERTDREQIKIREILCKDGVHLDSRQFEGNRLIGTYRGEVFEMSMNQISGEMLGTGGGWMEFWRREEAEGAVVRPRTVSSTSNRPLSRAEENDWRYTKITFRGDLTGNMLNPNQPQQRSVTTTFYDDVEVVYGPVKLPTQVIDPDDLPDQGGTMESDSLQITQLPKSGEKAKQYITMLAKGNARLTGKTYWGRADNVTFDESKNQFILRTSKPYYSELWRQLNPLRDPNHGIWQEIQYYPDTDNIIGVGGKSLNLQP